MTGQSLSTMPVRHASFTTDSTVHCRKRQHFGRHRQLILQGHRSSWYLHLVQLGITHSLQPCISPHTEFLMANVPVKQQTYFPGLLAAAQRAQQSGVVDATTKVQLHYWTHWERFCHQARVDPMLQGIPDHNRIELLQSWAEFICQGNAG